MKTSVIVLEVDFIVVLYKHIPAKVRRRHEDAYHARPGRLDSVVTESSITQGLRMAMVRS